MDMISLILAIIQGILEWFPVSSSGHLVLTEKLLSAVPNISLEIALHFGTLMAIFVYFRKDIVEIVRDIVRGAWNTSYAKLGFLLIIASIPAALVGFALRSFIENLGNNLLFLGFGWTITSLVLFIGSRSNFKLNDCSRIGYGRAFVIGISQALSLLPGISRSGMTISSGLFFGLNEKQAIRFSYLLAIPIIIGANLVTFNNNPIPLEFLGPAIICFLVGLIFINLSFNHILNNKKNLKFFGIYALILGIVSIIIGLQL